MAGFFDQEDQPGYEGKQNGNPYPSVPTLESPYGTPTGQPDPVTGQSPYFPSEQVMTPYVPDVAALAPPPTMTGGGFDWSQFQPVSVSSEAFTPAPTVASAQTANTSGMGGFTAPTGVDMLNDPGYQFRIDQARKAQEASAFGRLTGLTAGTQKAIGDTTQNAASAEYQNVFARALAGYQASANTAIANAGLTNQAASIANQNAEFNAGLGETHAQNQFGNQYSLANLGLNAAQLANQEAGLYGTNLSNLTTGYGSNLASLYGTAGNINATGAVTQGNLASQIPGALANLGYAGLAAYGGNQTNPYGTNVPVRNAGLPPGTTSLGNYPFGYNTGVAGPTGSQWR